MDYDIKHDIIVKIIAMISLGFILFHSYDINHDIIGFVMNQSKYFTYYIIG